MKNVTVRVRACDAPIKIANLGYLGPTKMNHLDYFARAYAQPRYRSAGNYDLDYVPWNCLTELARATCPGGPALGSFSVLPFTVYGKKQPKVTHNSKIAALRETLLQRGALRARARAMYTTAGDCRDANFAIASVLAERFRAHRAKKTG